METSRSEPAGGHGPGPPPFEVVGGGPVSAAEVAAIAAALEVVAEEPEGAVEVRRWRWSGRRWASWGRSGGWDG